MKIYLLYLLPKNKLYAVSDNKKYVKRFLSERNSKLFNVITRKGDDEELVKIIDDNKRIKLNIIPLEDYNGDHNIIGTVDEDNILTAVCENMSDICDYFKLHFTSDIPFKRKYIELIDNLSTISKNVNYHPIIQIDSVKLFYYLFKESFFCLDILDIIDTGEDYIDDFISQYKKLIKL